MSHPQHSNKVVFKGANFLPLFIACTVGACIGFAPSPVGVEPKAWQLLAIFSALIVGLIGKALPMGAISFLALTTLIVTQTLTLKEALSGFSHPIIWLVVAAFLISKSFIKTKLGMRLAYLLVAFLGKKTLGLGYGVAFTELILAPAIPSNTARAGGIIFPIVRALAVSFGSSPERHSQRLIGSYLTLTAYYCNLITSTMFITAMAANPLIVAVLLNHNIPITWGQWALAASLPGVLSLISVPYLVHKLYPPEIKETPEAKDLAIKNLQQMGPMSKYEWITLVVFFLLIVLWICGESYLSIDSTTVAFLGVCILLLTGVLTWEDIKREQEAWDTLIWFSTLVMIATYLNNFGLIGWMSSHLRAMMANTSWYLAWPMLVLSYFYSHYLFASNTAHVSSMYAAFLTVGLHLHIPPYLIALSLAFSSSLFACLTHYGTGSAPILFGSEYVNLKTWWKMGFIMSFIFLTIWIGIGSLWWKILHLW
ncbi:putative malate transporter YflS [Neochlamydia sp. TUME1]|uniref:anion permease n=1 Tax=Neochlamydia sp. TUME1 TaxID=1478174 RepID=UPI00057CB8CD|nr:anion permease [Neochlamydia sp. TUME1]KIC75861.1 putative malate transporter YflS [Neochlamydia sp. TUME1]